MKKLIVVADWAHDDLSRQEFRSAVEGFLKKSNGNNISFVASTSSTIHTAFLVNQIVETESRLGRSEETVIFQNTDPRIENSKGAEFMILKLITGEYVCGPNAGYDFSLIKHNIEQAFVYNGLKEIGQFRSRD